MDPEVVTKLLGRRSRDEPIARLSAREREVLELMAEGRSNTAIAQRLFVTEKAVSKHTTSIFTKLGLAAVRGRQPAGAGRPGLPELLIVRIRVRATASGLEPAWKPRPGRLHRLPFHDLRGNPRYPQTESTACRFMPRGLVSTGDRRRRRPARHRGCRDHRRRDGGRRDGRWLAATGRRVCVIDRSGPFGGTTGAGEGNILVSDQMPGPDLRWRCAALSCGASSPPHTARTSSSRPKGGVVVAHDQDQLAGLRDQATGSGPPGIEVTGLDQAGLREAEPHLAAGLAGGAFYPQDCQVQPMRAAMAYLGCPPPAACPWPAPRRPGWNSHREPAPA